MTSGEGGKNFKKSKSTLGASSLKINQGDASRLVGGIVEKGFSDEPGSNHAGSLSGPQPSVLPFPVARHRSQGPHWSAFVGGITGTVGKADDEVSDEEEHFGEYDQIMDFAKPVQRKEKKRLDFTNWRDIMERGDSILSHSLVENKPVKSKKLNQVGLETEISGGFNKPIVDSDKGDSCRIQPDDGTKARDLDLEDKYHFSEPMKERKQDSSCMAMDIEHALPVETSTQRTDDVITEIKRESFGETGLRSLETDDKIKIDTEMQYASKNKLIGEKGDPSIQDQIDAENHARLQKMSPDEIAEAQAEIMEKMNPTLINALKKRGLEKLKRKKNSGSDIAVDKDFRIMQEESTVINSSALSADASPDKLMGGDSEGKIRDIDNHDTPTFTSKSSSLWDIWSKRVEDVRNLRFSLDGNIIRSDFAGVACIDSVSSQSRYSVANVSERDFLRTEGDPAAAGYTIKEAVALTRSVVPGQRAFALHLLASVLDNAMHNIVQNNPRHTSRFDENGGGGDWEAIWAFALGPEPELALSLRLCLDDNHNSVVLACAKAIQSALSCDINESIFRISETIPIIEDEVSTAPVFRTKPDIDVGFLHGGFWKYNAKPSNILPFADDVDCKPEGEHSITDDVVVAGQDVAAGLVRMGVLPRIRYLLETEPSAALEESLLSITIAIARHSPTCATAVMICERLVQTVIDRFTMKEQMEITPSKIKSVTLLKVLACMDKRTCIEFIKRGTFQKVTWHLCRYSSLDQWIQSGKEACILTSRLLVEQLRLLKACIRYGYSVSYFVYLFPALSIWLNMPSFEKLVDNNILCEFAAISKEAYLVLKALTKRLPNFYKPMQQGVSTAEETETLSWSHVGPLVDLALEWAMVRNIGPFSRFFSLQKGEKSYDILQDTTMNSILWVVSSAMHMLFGVLEAVIPVDSMEFESGPVPWLPEFVPKIGIQLIKNRYFDFSEDNVLDSNDCLGGGSIVNFLSYLRCNCGEETSMASVSCLQGLLQVVTLVDKLIQLAKPKTDDLSMQYQSLQREDRVLANGILQSSLGDLRTLLTTHIRFAFTWHQTKPVEMFGRGGPAPGIGVGWGASAGGFWSMSILLAQVDARLITFLTEILWDYFVENPLKGIQMDNSIQLINSALEVCLIAGPRDRSVMDKIFDLLFKVPTLKCLELCIYQFVNNNIGFKDFEWKYEEEDYRLFCAVLSSHFKSRWLLIKKNSKALSESQHPSQTVSKNPSVSLDTIYEDMEASSLDHQGVTSLTKEWACQRLPLPNHWFLSPISVTHYSKNASTSSTSTRANTKSSGLHEVAEAGLFFLLGLEAMSSLLRGVHSSIQNVPVVWKLHALSVLLIDEMGVLENEKNRNVFETLQNIYGQLTDKSVSDRQEQDAMLKFQTEVHESYYTFVELLVEQFAAVSYGDLLFGRQVAIYLHRGTEASIRLAAWNALSHARSLELLPPLEKCFAKADGYLEPVEGDERILEAYVKSWVSGVLDKAAMRRSMSYALVLHHLASFIFETCSDKLSLRNQLIKSLLRDYSRKRQREEMMINLLQHKRLATHMTPGLGVTSSTDICQLKKRFLVLREACDGNMSLLKEVEKLERCVRK